MNVLIVDDEPIAQEILKKLAARVSFIEVIGCCDNAISALEFINTANPDLIFLDIQMPEMTGVEMLSMMERRGAQVIFTTAYPEYAIDGYALDATDYLLKPIPFDRFLKAVNKAHIRFKNSQQFNTKPDQAHVDMDSIWVKEGKRLVQIYLKDIVMVKAMADYMEFVMLDSRVIVHVTMSKLEELLPTPTFLRVNRSCIVKLSAIRSIQDLQIETILPKEPRISIGATYWDSVKSHFKELF
ncbi:LytR/AlgR family response regulator transcription factor [Sphingobacterium paludis]|jgi:DNA-binding LytR/AlgR family response regulator|uniref:LytTR family two component transcriptional regulator n=1 Tax=Sphingobacterium paludis TaxID=1476465 RepID=A0A4R7D568_9SPHI|nr:response regulator [Sphingobacterium paludis]TDS14855.1 LytTR family two component transcriptional regulator [Sphingobacterium paludis]